MSSYSVSETLEVLYQQKLQMNIVSKFPSGKFKKKTHYLNKIPGTTAEILSEKSRKVGKYEFPE